MRGEGRKWRFNSLVPPPEHPRRLLKAVEAATYRLHDAVASLPLVDRARAVMRRLGLDRGGAGRRAPLELLEEARGALERPAVQQGGVPSTLLTLFRFGSAPEEVNDDGSYADHRYQCTG